MNEETKDYGPTEYIGSKNISEGVLVVGTFTKKFEKEVQGSNGPFRSVTYFFKTDDGSIGLNKLGNLEYLMDRKMNIQEGESVAIEYFGRDDKGYHSFNVQRLDENSAA